MAILLPLCSLRTAPHFIPLHSVGPSQAALRECIPPWKTLCPTLLRTDAREELTELLSRLPLPTGIPIIPVLFWTFVARFALSLALPLPTTKGGIQTYGRQGRQSLLPYFSPESGCGLRVISPARKGESLSCLWGVCLPLEHAEVEALEAIKSSSAATLVLGDNSDVHHIALGPIGLLNHACSEHANIKPVSGP